MVYWRDAQVASKFRSPLLLARLWVPRLRLQENWGVALHRLLRFCHLLLTIETRGNRSGSNWARLQIQDRIPKAGNLQEGSNRPLNASDLDLVGADQPPARAAAKISSLISCGCEIKDR